MYIGSYNNILTIYLLVSEHTIRSINYFKNEKIHFQNLLRIPGNPALEKLINEKPTLQVRWNRPKYNSKIIMKCHTIMQVKKIKVFKCLNINNKLFQKILNPAKTVLFLESVLGVTIFYPRKIVR